MIIAAFYSVYNELGYGFLEKVYENALLYELRQRGLHAESQVPIDVLYKGMVVGRFFADILVENEIIIEIKVSDAITDQHKSQIINYLKSTGKRLGLILSFGSEAKFKRIIYN